MALPLSAKEYISRDGGHDLRGFGQERYSVSFFAEYGYNRSWEHFGNFDVMAHMPVVKNVQIDARMQYQTVNAFTGAVVLRGSRIDSAHSAMLLRGYKDASDPSAVLLRGYKDTSEPSADKNIHNNNLKL